MSQVVVAALYQFVTLNDYKSLRKGILDCMLENDIKGTMLLASEGINGTVAGRQPSIDILLAHLRSDERLEDIKCKYSYHQEVPFYRTRVKLKKEIVTMGVEGIDPLKVVGTYIKPENWNALISDPDVTLIDTRNKYETNIGTFRNAIKPETETFRDFPAFVRNNLDPARNRKVAMFCTGGIRCEKSTAYLKEQGFDEVYHLHGGILKYLENIPEDESLWQGECFVFDNRVAVNHALEKGAYSQCHACRMPITDEDKRTDRYKPGVSCPHCYDKTTAEQQRRFAERHKQVELARSRGEDHIGSILIEKDS